MRQVHDASLAYYKIRLSHPLVYTNVNSYVKDSTTQFLNTKVILDGPLALRFVDQTPPSMQTDGLCPQLAAPGGRRACGHCALLLWINGRKDSSALAFLLTRNALNEPSQSLDQAASDLVGCWEASQALLHAKLLGFGSSNAGLL